jgi:hypothetical protein
MADCDFNQAALHPAYPIKCRTSTQRTQAPESVDTPKSLPPLTWQCPYVKRNYGKCRGTKNCLCIMPLKSWKKLISVWWS